MSAPVCHKNFPEWGVRLLVPLSFASAAMDDILAQTNGCGRSGIEDAIIPDSLLWLDIKPACRVHDWMYIEAMERSLGHMDQDRLSAEEHFADGVFALNLIYLVNTGSKSRIMRWLRLRWASRYMRVTAVTDVLRVMPRDTLIAMGYDSVVSTVEGMVC